MPKTKVLIVDDHGIFRDGIKLVLSQTDDFEAIGEASNGNIFLEFINVTLPDIVLMDISMPIMDGITASKIALEKYPQLKIISLSMFGDEEYYCKMIEAGAKAVIFKKSGAEELLYALREVAKGNNYFSQELLKKLVFKISTPQNKEQLQISEREKDVLALICNGYTNKEIAEKLFISAKTVDRHRTSLLQKTETRNSAHLVMFAMQNKLISF
ncbi:MAG: response regulator transcription factor [Bacteroidales bacterium]|nr:response regulator transcription factor [Bacteroidales bacterium]